VGSASQRDGVQNVFAFDGESTGPNFPASASDLPVGSIAWQNPGNITSKNGSYATLALQTSFSLHGIPAQVTASGAGTAWTNPNNFVNPSTSATVTLNSASSQLLACVNPGLAVPANATITGVQMNFTRSSTTGGGTENLSIINNGVVLSPNFPSTIPTTSTARQVGGPGDLLSTGLTPAIVNSSTFGMFYGVASSAPSYHLVQTWQAATAANSLVVSPFYAVTAGNTLLISFDVFDESFASISDSQGNTYHQLSTQVDGGHTAYVYYVNVVTSGLLAITIHTSNNNFTQFVIATGAEVAGLLQPVAVDGVNHNQGNTGTSFSTGNVNTTNANDLIWTTLFRGVVQPSIPSGYTLGGSASINEAGANQYMMSAFRNVTSAGSYNPTWTMPSGINCIGFTVAFKLAQTVVSANNASLTVYYTVPGISDTLRANNFNFAISSDTVLGAQVGITGHAAGNNSFLAMLTDNTGAQVGVPKSFSFTGNDTRVVLGNLTDSWGAVLDSNVVNSTNFGVNIIGAAGDPTSSFFIDTVDIEVSQNPNGTSLFTWLKTYKRSTGNYNLALTKNGVLWLEDLQLSPGMLTSVYTGILPNSFAKSVTFDNREFIALSNLSEGYDMPRQWNGPFASTPAVAAPVGGQGFTNLTLTSAVSGQFARMLVVDQVNGKAFSLYQDGVAMSVVDLTTNPETQTAFGVINFSGGDKITTSMGNQVPPYAIGPDGFIYAISQLTYSGLHRLYKIDPSALTVVSFVTMPYAPQGISAGGTSSTPLIAVLQADNSFINYYTSVFNGSTMALVGTATLGSTSGAFGEVSAYPVFDSAFNLWFVSDDFSVNGYITEVSAPAYTTATTRATVPFGSHGEVIYSCLYDAGTNSLLVMSSDAGAPLFNNLIGQIRAFSLNTLTFTGSAGAYPATPAYDNRSTPDFGIIYGNIVGQNGHTFPDGTFYLTDFADNVQHSAPSGDILNKWSAATLATSAQYNLNTAPYLGAASVVGWNSPVGNFGSATAFYSKGGTVKYLFLPIGYPFSSSGYANHLYVTRLSSGGAPGGSTPGPHHLDRVSQCGPAFAPSVSFTATLYPITSLSQNAPLAFPIGNSNPGSWVTLSTGVGATAPGSLLQFYFFQSYTLPAYVTQGSNIVLTGLSSIGGTDVNNGAGTNPAYYTVVQVGSPIQGQSYYMGLAVTVPANSYANSRVNAGTAIQPTTATVVTSVPVPTLEVGGSFSVVGANVAAWNGSYSVVSSTNAAQLSITSTSATGGRATYSYTLISGTNPTAGELVTCTNLDNGNGIFNGNNLVISTANASQFTVLIATPNLLAEAENGSAVVSGNNFQFDPLQAIANSSGGSVTVGGSNTSLLPGARKVVVLFQTRNGFITAPSPFYQFNTVGSVTSLSVSNVAIGGPEILQRIVALTPANSSNFYYSPEPVVVNVGGINTTYSATILPDNTSTSATFTLTDDILTAATAIDVPGNNLFNCVELGNVLGIAAYKNRILAWGEENKIQNFGASLSFNGGIAYGSSQGGGGSSSIALPGGWTATNPTGQVVTSPVYGLSYEVTGTGASVVGLISQPAYQDENQVAIINNNISYGIRVFASCPSGATTGSVVFELYDPSSSTQYAASLLPLSSLQETLTRNDGVLMSGMFGVGNLPPVPPTLLLRIWGSAIPSGATYLIDRAEIYDRNDPVNKSVVRVSYAGNPEAFEDLSGELDISGYTQEGITDVFVDRDIAYICTASAVYQTQDNGQSEPGGEGGWTIRQTTEIAGSVSVNGTAAGEEWRILASKAGLFIYWGGEPIPIMQELQPTWNLINWNAGNTIVAFNDPVNRRLGVAIPIPTGPGTAAFENGWFSGAPANPEPTTPNILLVMSYRELNSAQQIADSPAIHTTFTGKVNARELSRKWSWWGIPASYAASILRADGTTPIVYCSNVYPKVYTQVIGSNDDDGAAIGGYYVSSAFVRDDTAEAKGLTETRFLYLFMWLNASGVGELDVTLLPNSLDSPYATVLAPFQLFESPFFDIECPIQEEANRMFVRFGTDGVGETFNMSRIIMTLRRAPSTEVTGLDPMGALSSFGTPQLPGGTGVTTIPVPSVPDDIDTNVDDGSF
jgi:hypothetical protein